MVFLPEESKPMFLLFFIFMFWGGIVHPSPRTREEKMIIFLKIDKFNRGGEKELILCMYVSVYVSMIRYVLCKVSTDPSSFDFKCAFLKITPHFPCHAGVSIVAVVALPLPQNINLSYVCMYVCVCVCVCR